jgi:activator of 2-hydroxyglutaryl-CoA dehydratase
MMKIGILKKGDEVLSVNHDFVAVHRKNGEVDIVPLIKDETGLRVDIENIVTIGYGNNTVQVQLDDDVVVTTF